MPRDAWSVGSVSQGTVQVPRNAWSLGLAPHAIGYGAGATKCVIGRLSLKGYRVWCGVPRNAWLIGSVSQTIGYGAGETKSWFLVLSVSGYWLVSVIFGELPIHSLSAAVSQIEEFLQKVVISFENRSKSSVFQWKLSLFSRQFSAFAHALCCLVYSSPHFCLSSWIFHYACCISVCLSIHDTTLEGILSSGGFSLTLTLTLSIGIWHDTGATTSWSSVVSLSCSCRISLYPIQVLVWWLSYSNHSFQLIN